MKFPRIEPGDTYHEGRYLVFTAQYLLKRETCCGYGCRHCPYDKLTGEPLPEFAEQILEQKEPES